MLIKSFERSGVGVYEPIPIEEMKMVNNSIGRAYCMISVLLFNSLPEYTVGDFLVDYDRDAYFLKSKYIAAIDSRFELYKK